MGRRYKKILIVAGEPSGDLHGSEVAKALLRRDPEINIYGVGGNKLKSAGVRIMFNSDDLAVVGITEALEKFGLIRNVFKRLKRSLTEDPPDLVILIDYPEFNLRLARVAQKRGIPVLYYISPQVWAWRKGRVKKIARRVDRLVVVFPFEAAYYQKENVDVTFVGHPLVEAVRPKMTREDARQKFGLDPSGNTIGLLPGSRKREIFSLLPAMLAAAEIISSHFPHLQFILPLAPTCKQDDILGIVRQYNIEIKIINDYYYEVIDVSDFIIVASGTATLETALLCTPMLIVYKTSFLTYIIGKMLIKVKNIGLVNIVAGKKIVPELIQGRVTPEEISREVIKHINDDHLISGMKKELEGVRERLEGSGVAEKVAIIAHKMMDKQGNK